MTVGIVDTGGANLRSVVRAVERCGGTAVVTDDVALLGAASHLILPGVGHAAPIAKRLHDRGVDAFLRASVQPLLGICLGMQLLYDGTEEGDTVGLGFVPGTVGRMISAPSVRIPHLGWNALHDLSGPLFEGIDDGAWVVFLHSYAAAVGPFTVATATHASPFSAAIARDHRFGVQFHPEKSGDVGLHCLRNFLRL